MSAHADPVPSVDVSASGRPSHGLTLSVVIVSWNTRELLARCIASLPSWGTSAVEETPTSEGSPTGEVFVVDNASRDGSAQSIRELFPCVRVIENPENVGFARANNQAYPLTAGRYVLLLNPDTEVRPDALEALVRFMDARPDAGAAAARLIETDGRLQLSCHPAPTLSRELWRLFHLDAVRHYGSYPMERWDPDTPRAVDVAQGACLILRREAVDQIGLFDEDYFIYSEEVDLCARLRRSGWKIFWVPAAAVVHLGGQSTRQVAVPMFLRLYQGKVLYFRKQHGRSAAKLYKLVLYASALARLLLSPLVFLERADARQHHLALAGRYARLIRALPTF